MFDVDAVRDRFPALARDIDGHPAAYLDGPGGTQAVDSAIEAMAGYLRSGSSNLGGPFATSREADEVTESARAAMADFFGAAHPDEIAFGQNMTSITFAVSRALAAGWKPGDEIVVTRLDHDANITPWTTAAAEREVTVRWIDFDPERGCGLNLDEMEQAIGPRTRLVAVTHASNAVGTLVDAERVVELAHAHGALVYVDAVHFAPHRLIDVQRIGCDFLAASSYKFFGPHTGVLYGRTEHLSRIKPYKVRPAPARPPGSWETGTQSFESLAGVTAAVDYVAELGAPAPGGRRSAVEEAMTRIGEYEEDLARRFLAGCAEIPAVTVYGRPSGEGRTPTFAVSVAGVAPRAVASHLGARGIFVWSGHYYAVEVMQRLGVLDAGGLVRIGFVHYNTAAEVDRVLGELDALSRSA